MHSRHACFGLSKLDHNVQFFILKCGLNCYSCPKFLLEAFLNLISNKGMSNKRVRKNNRGAYQTLQCVKIMHVVIVTTDASFI